MARYKKRAASERGAALLILLALAGIGAASLLVSALGHSGLEQRRERRTVLLLGQATDALVGFATQQGRLPRPAISAADGRERQEPCTSEASCTGLLPWVTLGIEGADAWGKRLRYSVTPAYTVVPVMRVSTVATKTVQTRTPDGALRYLAGQETCNLAVQCAPLVVLSHGRNNFGVTVQGVTQPNTAQGNLDEQLNAEGDVHFIGRAAGTDATQPGGEFDDLVSTIPLAYLYQQMGAARKLP